MNAWWMPVLALGAALLIPLAGYVLARWGTYEVPPGPWYAHIVPSGAGYRVTVHTDHLDGCGGSRFAFTRRRCGAGRTARCGPDEPA